MWGIIDNLTVKLLNVCPYFFKQVTKLRILFVIDLVLLFHNYFII